MIKETIVFRPRNLAPKRHKALIFFIIVTAISAIKTLLDPSSELLAPLVGGSILTGAGAYLALRQRFPGRPSLTVDKDGLSYRRWKNEQSMAWSEVKDIVTDNFTGRMTIFSLAKEPPIHMHPHMIAEDGREWSMLIEQYWKR